MDIAEEVAALGGLAHKRQLVRRGARDLDLTRAVRSGYVIRARRGWYTTFADSDPRTRAARVGGRLTGISAIAAAGGWVLGAHPLHVSVPANASRLRSPGSRRKRLSRQHNVVIHYDDPHVAERGSADSVAIMDALARVLRDEPRDRAIAALDWALNAGEIDLFDIELLRNQLPARVADIPANADPDCDSIPESLSRSRLVDCGHVVRSQVPVMSSDGMQRVDLVVDGHVGLDIDGDEFHRQRFEADRSKDVSITIDRLHAMRPSARMVFGSWDRLHRAIHVALEMRGVNPPPLAIQEKRESRGRRPAKQQGRKPPRRQNS